jgi:hypothetical protein
MFGVSSWKEKVEDDVLLGLSDLYSRCKAAVMDAKVSAHTVPKERGPRQESLPVIGSEGIFRRSYAIYASGQEEQVRFANPYYSWQRWPYALY